MPASEASVQEGRSGSPCIRNAHVLDATAMTGSANYSRLKIRQPRRPNTTNSVFYFIYFPLLYFFSATVVFVANPRRTSRVSFLPVYTTGFSFGISNRNVPTTTIAR